MDKEGMRFFFKAVCIVLIIGVIGGFAWEIYRFVWRTDRLALTMDEEPLPITNPAGEEYIKVVVGEMKELAGEQVLLTPSNNSDTEYMLIDSDLDGKIRRLTVDCSTILGVSELVYRGPIHIQVDIYKEGEWVFGAKQELNQHEVCQFILSKRSPFRCYLWKPEGDDWICEFSYASRWW